MDGREPRAYSRLAVALFVVAGVWIVLHGLGVLDRDSVLTFPLAALLAVIATVVGLRRWHPSPVWPWWLYGAALVLFLVGNTLRYSLDTLGDLSPDRSNLPDIVILPGYACLAVGTAGLAGVRLRNRDDLDAILDGIIAALAALMLAWAFLVTPVLADSNIGLLSRATIAVYPVCSAFVFAMGARAAFARGRAAPIALQLYMVTMFCILMGDTVFDLVDHDIYDLPLHAMEVPYLLAFLVYSIATLHPSIRQLGHNRPSDDVSAGRGRLFSVAVALLLPIAVLLVVDSNDLAESRLALGIIAVLLVGVGVFRMWRALREHTRSQARLAYEATHDALTGLPNRVLVSEQVERALRIQTGGAATVTLLHMDIDRFRLVNDTMGHGVGDALLVAVAERLTGKVRSNDLVGRVGGDEFLVVVLGLPDEGAALDFGSRARLMFKEPFTVNGTGIPVTASVGVAFSRVDRTGAEDLLRDADTALNHAKPGGGDSVAIYDASMREQVAERLLLERELREALTRDDLTLHYQPKLRMLSGQVVGLEALLRWPHRELGMVRPDKFIAIAEDTGMIVELGAWVIDRACAELARLRQAFRAGSNLRMSVNVSARQLRSETLVDTITRALVEHDVPPDCLCLELTESILMENLEQVRPQLEAIRSSGTHVSIDDFGTGYSSLAYLSQLPVDEIKIDRTFVHDLNRPSGGANVIQAVVDIASALGMTTVAEGVETQQEADRLRALGCTEVQGFLYGRPTSSAEIDQLLADLGMVPVPHLRSVESGPRQSLGHIA